MEPQIKELPSPREDCSMIRVSAMLNNSFVGYAEYYRYHDSATCVISNLEVNSFERKKGIGHHLLKHCMHMCKNKLWCYQISLWVDDKDSWLVNWYERNGFQYDNTDDEGRYWMTKVC